MSRFINMLQADKLAAFIRMETPIDTGALLSSVQVASVEPNKMVVVVGARSVSSMGHRKPPSAYVRYVNEGLNRVQSERVKRNKGFIERGCKNWAETVGKVYFDMRKD